jgi:DNA-binding MarR family transcriptional regulator
MESQAKQTARKFWATTPIIMKTMMKQTRQGEHNIAPVHFRILQMLAHTDCNISELAERQGVSLPSISATAQTLVDRGWLERNRSSDDRRVVNLNVTEEGRRVLHAEHERLLDWMAQRLEPLSEQELLAVETGMDILSRVFESEEHHHGAHLHHHSIESAS